MSSVGFIADSHLGNYNALATPNAWRGLSSRAEETARALDSALCVALVEKCDVVVVAGDLFQSSRPEAPLVEAACSTFNEWRKAGRQAVVLAGNHDIFGLADGANALGALREVGVTVVEYPTTLVLGGFAVVCIPFRPPQRGENASSIVAGVLTETAKRTAPTIVVAHYGLGGFVKWDAKPDYVPHEVADALVREFDVALMLHGHGHVPRTHDNGRVMQIGALGPRGFNDIGAFGRLVVARRVGTTTKIDVRRLPGPRFMDGAWDGESDLRSAMGVLEDGCAYRVRLRGPAARAEYARKWGVENRVWVEYVADVVRDEGEQRARNAQQAQTPQEVVAEYVNAMPLENVSRDDVRRTVAEAMGWTA